MPNIQSESSKAASAQQRASTRQTLDILTERGRVAAQLQIEAGRIVAEATRTCVYHTPTEGPAAVDAVITFGNKIIAVAEIKSRSDMTLEQLQTARGNEWLVTAEKIRQLSAASKMLGVPGYGLLYLPRSGVVLSVKLCEEDGTITSNYRVARTQTQRTINGGTISRVNAFIDVSSAQLYRKKLH
jgi:hypothetical protein